jgi:hypothetical protein
MEPSNSRVNPPTPREPTTSRSASREASMSSWAGKPFTARIPEFQHLAVGDHVPDGPPEAGCEFIVARLEPGHHLVLHSEDHLPPGWKERYGAWIDWTWAFVLDDLGDGRTRFIFRSRGRAGPAWVAAGYLLAVIPADFVMSRQMLRGLKSRAERTCADRG